jgi:hypothetical protein
MTELHYDGLYISVSGVTGKSYVSGTGAISPIKDLVDDMNARAIPESTAVRLIKNEMIKRGYGDPREESR